MIPGSLHGGKESETGKGTKPIIGMLKNGTLLWAEVTHPAGDLLRNHVEQACHWA